MENEEKKQPDIIIEQPIFDGAIDAEAKIDEADEIQHVSGSRPKHTPKSVGKTFVQVLGLGSMQASKATGLDMDMSEDEAVEMEQATQDFMDSLGLVELPPWATFLMATGTFVGGRVLMYHMAKNEVEINGDHHGQV